MKGERQPRTVIRRRGGDRNRVVRTEATNEGTESSFQLWLPRTHEEAVASVQRTAESLAAKEHELESSIDRRKHQETVYSKVGLFYAAQAERLAEDPAAETEFGRIILPPRTGKTVVAGEIIASAGTAALMVVPQLDLAASHARKLREQLPGTKVGLLTGNTKNPKAHGVTVTTYSSLQSMFKNGRMPDWLQRVPLIFADEAHQSMTEARMAALQGGFDSAAIRIALTATPDYDSERTLDTHFPHEIHTMPSTEAFDMKLLAEWRSWVYEVDADGSEVKMKGEDFDPETLERIMSSAPVFQKAMELRLQEENRDAGALMTCVGITQAKDLKLFLDAHAPDMPEAKIIIGDTPDDEREDLKEAFEDNPGQTLIVVGTLIQGWDSERCKVLVDLAPGCSFVRQKQKYYRPLTKSGDAEGRLYVLVPAGLQKQPLFPLDVLGVERPQDYIALDRPKNTPPRPQLQEKPAKPLAGGDVESVAVESRAIIEGAGRPTLEVTDLAAVKEVVMTAVDAQDVPGYRDFTNLIFQHPMFTGTGKSLLRYLNIPDAEAYGTYMETLFAKEAEQAEENESPLGNPEMVALLRQFFEPEPVATPEEILLEKEQKQWIANTMLTRLNPRQRLVIQRRFEEDMGYKEIGEELGISGTMVKLIENKAMYFLRRAMATYENSDKDV